jgi:hypothetical protein
VPNDPDKAARTLDAAGIAYRTREVLVVRVLDEPGMLGDVTLVMSKAGINIDSVYVTTQGHIILGVDDMAGAIQICCRHGGHVLRVKRACPSSSTLKSPSTSTARTAR